MSPYVLFQPPKLLLEKSQMFLGQWKSSIAAEVSWEEQHAGCCQSSHVSVLSPDRWVARGPESPSEVPNPGIVPS